LIDTGDTVQVKSKERIQNRLKENLPLSKDRTVPAWLEFNPTQLTAKVLRRPEKSDIGHQINEQLIVELYSK
jgi:small subunit ribosomal protein S4